MTKNEQEVFWNGNFGKDYNARNLRDLEKLDMEYRQKFGISRSELNNEFLGNLKIHSILECGCGVGNQLLLLKKQGFDNLYGVDIQSDAVDTALKRLGGGIINESLYALSYNEEFDMVYTSGVLIHIHPENLTDVMKNIVRASKRYVWGYEFYHENFIEMNYRKHANKLWKGNYCQLYLDNFPLKLVKRKQLPYLDSNKKLANEMFLLEKTD